MSFTELPADAVLDSDRAYPSPDASPSSGGIHFRDAAELAAFRKEYPDKATLSDKEFLDWFGRSRTVATTASVGQPEAPLPEGFVELPNEVPLDSGHPYRDALGRGVRDALNVAGSAADLVTSPIKLAEGALGITPPDYKGMTSQLSDKLGLPDSETGGQKLVSAINEGAGLGALTAGAGGALVPLGGVMGTIGETLAAQPVVDAIASGAANAGSEMARQHDVGPLGQLAASLAGGFAGAGGAVGSGNAFRRIFQSVEPSELLAAFQRQQVTPMAAQLGGFGSKMMNSGAKATLGGLPLAAAAEKSIATAKAARDRIAAMMGNVADDTGAGQAAQAGVRKFIDTTQAKASRLYDAIPIRGERPASLANTQRALGELNAGFESNPELSRMLSDGRLQGFEAALTAKTKQVPTGLLDAGGNPLTRPVTAGGGLSWQDLKAFRSYIGELAGRPALQESTSKEALQRLYGALSEDMRATATNESPQALRAFTRANTFYRARQDRIENTLKLILGNDFQRSPESAFAQIDRWAREGGDAARLARILRSLPEDEAATVRATVFSRLGRAAPGQQNASVDAFSPSSFGTQWAKLDHRAKSILFPGVEYRQSLDDIARISEAMKSSEMFANTSRTALADRIGKNLLGAAAVSYILHPTGAIAGEGIGYAAGHLLASPRFARWLASAPKKPIGPATLAHINRLTTIAAAEPTIANDVLALQERLASAFTNSPQRAAAGDSSDSGRSRQSNAPDQSAQSRVPQ